MREIKFRAWDGREMEFDITVGCHSKDGKGARNTVVIIDDGACWFAQEEPYNAIMQYTGLKDKNGKEIYEGDILKDDTDCWLEVKFGKLPFDKSGDCVCTFPSFYAKSYGKLGQAPCHECEHIGDWMKIIGNIYENPDWRVL